MTDTALLSVAEMTRADALAVEHGVPSLTLMENAGRGVAAEIRHRWQPKRVVILCGPGNNGGDGYVVARLLKEAGIAVKVAALGNPKALKGDARINADRWVDECSGDIAPLSDMLLASGFLDHADIVVDALFGAGLSRPVDGDAAKIINAINAAVVAGGLICVAVDVPSGVHGDTGEVLGTAPDCALTVTFFRAKPGHVLLPGRLKAGTVTIADIGIPDAVLMGIQPKTALNGPGLWLDKLPMPTASMNKYDRGHLVIWGGAEMTGAARLAARGARRAGAGMVTIASPPEAFAVYAAGDPGVIVHPVANREQFVELLADRRRNVVLIGPGAGRSEQIRRRVRAALESESATVLDADAISAFESAPETLLGLIRGTCVMTPHEGEFRRLFPGEGDKLSRARAAAEGAGAVIILKGADTVIAAPDGRTAINANAPAELATAGTGDVLAGIVSALLAQGMPAFEAACAAVLLHGAAAASFGPGLIAEDISEGLPAVIASLRGKKSPNPA